jgi:hypothetical protein
MALHPDPLSLADWRWPYAWISTDGGRATAPVGENHLPIVDNPVGGPQEPC